MMQANKSAGEAPRLWAVGRFGKLSTRLLPPEFEFLIYAFICSPALVEASLGFLSRRLFKRRLPAA